MKFHHNTKKTFLSKPTVTVVYIYKTQSYISVGGAAKCPGADQISLY